MNKVLRRTGIAVTLVVVAMCWGWAYFAAREGYWATVAIALVASVTWPVSIRVVLASTSTSPQVEFTPEGTVLKPDARIDTAVRRMTGTGAALCWAALVVSVPYGNLYIPIFSTFPESFVIIPLACLGAAVGLTWWRWGYRRRGISYVQLTPEGFRFPALVGTHHGRWDDVVGIGTEARDGHTRFWPPMVLTMRDESRCVLESPGIYTPEGTALIELVRHYWQHPQERVELTTGRAVDRLHALRQFYLDSD
ncbi:hypothetical protein [Mycolicibacterium gilvum]|uniref:Transmembrane protein n=1 Tax=Mycolicibacterium gilvum (strain DSM 45189 / LMG 24558 / Spyr1) TaxID=278137 RepID=E6TA56_MYCSR|nr:hypothetical protein [Mycolicibacterium gilvum]ADT97328.1 hypothetical protein Mspyr1_06230 [Mycolicibacterium gilvum Spyr1]